MIYGKLDTLPLYLGMDANLDTAIRWLRAHSPAELPLGRTEIDGSQVFVNVMDAAVRQPAEASYEIHANYMDLQLDIAGCEAFAVACGPTQPKTPFDAAQDFGLVDGAASAQGTLGPQMFVIFPAGEPHMPTLDAGTPTVRKAVFKIRRSGS